MPDNAVIEPNTDETVPMTPIQVVPLPETKAPRTRGNVNASQLAQLETAEKVARTAERAPYAAMLATREITAAQITALLLLIVQCRDSIATGVQSSANRATATREEATYRAQLISLLRQIQASANQKYARDPHQKPQLRAYWVGSGLAVNRASLAESSHSILEKLQTDSLPGITAEFRESAHKTRQSWIDANQRQSSSLTAATHAREDTLRLLKIITDERLKIQFAIDAAYPVGAEGSEAIRAEFGIPKTRPFRAR